MGQGDLSPAKPLLTGVVAATDPTGVHRLVGAHHQVTADSLEL